MKDILKIWILILSAMSLAGCNDDIFIDRVDLPEMTEVKLLPEGDDHTMIIPVKGLRSWGIENAEPSEYMTYYGPGGVVGPDSPASELTSIWFEDFHSAFGVSINGNYLYFNNLYNCTGKDENITVFLRYEDGTRFVNFYIPAGEKLKVDWVSYFGNGFDVTPDVETSVNTVTYANNSSETVRVYVMPYKSTPAKAFLSADEPWVKDIEVEMSLPVLFDDSWGLHSDGFILNCDTPYEYKSINSDMRVPRDIPAETEVKVVKSVSYSKVLCRGEMYIRNPYTDDVFVSAFTLTTLYPVSYEIKIEKED